MHDFDPGPASEPFASLARDYPGEETYPADLFRVEWGPIFHRGRLDGTARVLVVGQDPGQHESVARRILVGEAGQRVQGFLAKLGIESSYVMVNAMLYSVYGQPSSGDLKPIAPKIAAYRDKWLDAVLGDGKIKVVVGFGGLAQQAFNEWLGGPKGQQAKVTFQPLPHPTYPESSSKGSAAKKAEATTKMLAKWNEGLKALDNALDDAKVKRDVDRQLKLYGTDLKPEDRSQIPEVDLPAGAPPWMRSLKTWATRVGDTPEAKRATIEVVIPKDERPWA
jgi:uracil-DNA glycosylase